MNWICIIDADNCQAQYAHCLQTIFEIEKFSRNEPAFANLKDLKAFNLMNKVSNAPINDAKMLEEIDRLLAKENSGRVVHIDDSIKFQRFFQKYSIAKHTFQYYFRISLGENENDIVNLHYLILLLQSISGLTMRAAVQIRKPAGTWTTSDYFRVSHYLHFVQKQHPIFYSIYDEKDQRLQLLTRKSAGVQRTFFPVIEIQWQSLAMLVHPWRLKPNYKNEKFKDLYKAFAIEGNDDEEIIGTMIQIALRMLLQNLDGRKYNSTEKKKQLVTFICALLEQLNGISTLELLLLGMLGNNWLKTRDKQESTQALGTAQELAGAVRQILENIVNHSEHAKGVFSLRIQENETYMAAHYPGYQGDPEKNRLELLIADSNIRDENMVANFLSSSKADPSLRQAKTMISIQNLFGSYQNEEQRQLWEQARQKRPTMCYGLLTFAGAITLMKGAVKVRSSNQFQDQILDNYFYNFGHGEEQIALNTSLHIPGTQFAVIVDHPPKLLESSGESFDFPHLVYATTYKELAQVLTCDEDPIDIPLSEVLAKQAPYITTQEQKDILSIKWKEWFDKKIENIGGIGDSHQEGNKNAVQYRLFSIDLAPLCKDTQNSNGLEPFCKGFLSSRFFSQQKQCQKKNCILLLNATERVGSIFRGTLMAVGRQLCIDDTNVYLYPASFSGKHLPYNAASLHDLLKRLNLSLPDCSINFPRVFPYALFLRNEQGQTLYEAEILRQAQASISDKENQGFKISKTHMRLGNKIHLDTFYEMALFFENPNYAYYTAFLLVRNLLKSIDIKIHKQILIYGYASYSRSIVWAVVQILHEYCIVNKIEDSPELEFVIYQNDLKIESKRSHVQMYFSKGNWKQHCENIWECEDTVLVTLVPIGSSLTTFSKMMMELSALIKQTDGKRFAKVINYMAFWVRDLYLEKNKDKVRDMGWNPEDPLMLEKLPTDEEEAYINEIDPKGKMVWSPGIPSGVQYLVRVSSNWANPLQCDKCFPTNVLLEYPLVETDPTSTVPTQQFYCEPEQRGQVSSHITLSNTPNDIRMANLKGHILYGHVSRGANHYQYYIKTREYFQQEKDLIKEWIKSLMPENYNQCESSKRAINVLVVPQRTNNVEFSQFVYEFYFGGEAECITLNTEKEFRSNLLAEYHGLFMRLRKENAEENREIVFHYVDISILSGDSFARVVSLLSSGMRTSNFRFKKVFLLISRMSDASKKAYVEDPNQNFHTYLQINISAMRTFGDSCVPCKHQKEAEYLFENSATKSTSEYWEKKIHQRCCETFDSLKQKEETADEGYRRMICAHRLTGYIRLAHGGPVEDYFISLRNFFQEIVDVANGSYSNPQGVYTFLQPAKLSEWLSAALKVVVRPFFSYDYKLRCAVMDLYLVLAEIFLTESNLESCAETIQRELKDTSKKYLLREENLKWICDFACELRKTINTDPIKELVYIRDHILKGLADIKSNYLFRKKVLLQVSEKLHKSLQESHEHDVRSQQAREFYLHYLRSILRLTHSSSDEIKSLWLEHLLQYGTEYPQEKNMNPMQEICQNNGIAKLVQEVPTEIQPEFQNFLELLLVENNRPLYQRVEKLVQKRSDDFNNPNLQYFERNVEKFLEYEYSQTVNGEYNKKKKEQCLNSLKELYEHLTPHIEEEALRGEQRTNLTVDYEKLRIVLRDTADLQESEGKKSKVVLLGKRKSQKTRLERQLNLPDYYSIAPEEKKITELQGLEEIQKSIAEAEKFGLEKDGYALLKCVNDENHYNVVLALNNNYKELVNELGFKTGMQKISPIYIYLCCELNRQRALMLVRKILMFRRKLIALVERDFNNNAVAIMIHQHQLAQILAQDRVGDHADSTYVEALQQVLMTEKQEHFVTQRWTQFATPDGLPGTVFDVNQDEKYPKLFDREKQEDNVQNVREWFLLRGYVNSRISRMFHTMARSESTVMTAKEANAYYAFRAKNHFMYPARNLSDLFFLPVEGGLMRKNYLRQMMETHCFIVEGEPDYKKNKAASVEERLDNLSKMLKKYDCIDIEKDGTKYAYLSEYLAIILLDCFISALKASEYWKLDYWSARVFCELKKLSAPEKCIVNITREHTDAGADYLVITNKVFVDPEDDKEDEQRHIGMSLKTIADYIYGLWELKQIGENTPEAFVTISDPMRYVTKMLILKPESRGDLE